MVCYVVYILVPFVVVQILFHSSSLSVLVVEASWSWCEIGMLASIVRSVVASLTKESAFSFPSIPWCDGIQVIIICLWSLVSSVYVCFLNHLHDFVLFNGFDGTGVCYRVYRSQGICVDYR